MQAQCGIHSIAWLIVLLIVTESNAKAASGDTTIPGFRNRITGELIKYHSPDPGMTQALVVRSVDADRRIEWETEPVPERIEEEFVSFVWLFALDVNPAGHRFKLSINGEHYCEFSNPSSDSERDWTINGQRGSTFRFRATMVDRFGDLMGYAILRVPRAELKPGKPLRISVAGESAGSQAWYITFPSVVREDAVLSVRPALVRGKTGNYQPIVVTITHLGSPQEITLSTSFGIDERHQLELGGNHFELQYPEVSDGKEITVRVLAGAKELYTRSIKVAPVRHWTIDLVQHAHTDVGYTRPQTEILPEHLRFIDTALDYCEKTDGYPDDARFRWTCEGSWAVREYLKSRTPAQIDRLRRRANEGRIEITGMFLNMSELIDEASYAAFLRPIRTFREHGLPVTTAMQDDVNGVAWCLADYFPKIGIEYLVMGQHGHRALIPFEMPTCFWWESRSGSRVFAYRPDHYMTGNFWGVHTGSVETVEGELLNYLSNLEQSRYPFDRVAVQHSGYTTDNSPPSTASSELVRRWNEKYVWPHLRCSLVREFPEFVRRNYAAELGVHRLAWTDWWTDGFGSAARESAAARITQGRLSAVEGLLAMGVALGLDSDKATRREIDAIRDDLIFWGEHTLGSAESIREPLCENSQVQWAQKSAYVWDAVKRQAVVGEVALGRFQTLGGTAASPRLLIVNTLNFPRSGLLEIFADNEHLPIDRKFRILDERDQPIPMQRLKTRDEGSYWGIWTPTIPSFGWQTFRVQVDAQAPAPEQRMPKPAHELENKYYRLRLNPKTGAITSLMDRELKAELVDPASEWGLGQVIHEALDNREQLESFMLEKFSRRSLTDVVIDGIVEGPIWTSLTLHGELPGCQAPGGLRCEIRLFHTDKRLELHYTIQKRRVFDPEGLYVAFPFGPRDGSVAYETLGGIVAPATDILPGAASDWQTLQSHAAVQWKSHQVVLTSNEIPLIQVGGLNLGKFQRNTRVDIPYIFSWVMNNYWTTNFCASQEGEFRWSYALTSLPETTHAAATRFGRSSRVPMLGRILPHGTGNTAAQQAEGQSLLPIDVPNLMLVAARPTSDGNGMLLHLREIEGKPARLATQGMKLAGKPSRVREVDILERETARAVGPIEFAPFETRILIVQSE